MHGMALSHIKGKNTEEKGFKSITLGFSLKKLVERRTSQGHNKPEK
jgi:hypothetical protein